MGPGRIRHGEVVAYPATLKRGELPGEEYRVQAFRIAEQAITLAGYRLADLLNQDVRGLRGRGTGHPVTGRRERSRRLFARIMVPYDAWHRAGPPVFTGSPHDRWRIGRLPVVACRL